VAATRVISIVGKKDSGKTSLVVALASEWGKRGRRVATIKHGAHPAEVDKPGTDTHRHYTEGRAEKVLMEFPGGRVLFERTQADGEPLALVRGYLGGADIVIVEGFRKSPLPKIEVHRKSKHQQPLFDPASPDAKQWVALVTDDETLRVAIPTFRFTDTGWLVTLAQLAWDRAVVVD
jgi:molybdopterin-guanine dinucleotide biosynthesis protein MobB